MGAALASIGLTGGIGSGKSTVAAQFVNCGAWLVDTDAIARELTAPGGAALPTLRAAFGPDILGEDGALDRARMRGLAFNDASAKRKLEELLHPMIGAMAGRRAAEGGGRTVVYDVPLLAESSHWRARVGRVVVVDCPEALQVERVTRRSGWAADAVRGVIAQQASRATRRAIADAIVFNGAHTTVAQLASGVRALWDGWRCS